MISTTKIFSYSINIWIILVNRDRLIQRKMRHQISPLRNLVSFFLERGNIKEGKLMLSDVVLLEQPLYTPNRNPGQLSGF